MTLWVITFAFLIQVTAFKEYASNIPNGKHFDAVGHIGNNHTLLSCIGSSYHQNRNWPSYCYSDCDNDGRTNGEELGDTCCEWKSAEDNSKLRKSDLSDPSDPHDTTTAPKCKKSKSKTTTSLIRNDDITTKSISADDVVSNQEEEKGSNSKVFGFKGDKVTKESGSEKQEGRKEKGSEVEEVIKEKGSKVTGVTMEKEQNVEKKSKNVTSVVSPRAEETQATEETEVVEKEVAGGSSSDGSSDESSSSSSDSDISNSASCEGGREYLHTSGAFLAIWISLLL